MGYPRRLLAFVAVSAFLSSGSLHALTWVEVAQLTHAGGAAHDFFGESVAIDGDVAVVGDLKAFFNGVERAGVAHVFVRSGGKWSEAAELLPSDSVGGDHFGASVAIRGDTIAVGSPTINLGRDGRVYVFLRPSGGWSGTLSENARLDASGLGERFELGASVAFAGDSIVSTSRALSSVLVVFNKPVSGWSGTVLPNGFPFCSLNGHLGAVAASGDVIIAGDPTESLGTVQHAGKAFVWLKPSGGWSGLIFNAAELLPSDPIDQGFFGDAVAIDGTTALVTTAYPVVDFPPTPNKSKGYVFERPPAGWAGTLNENAQLFGSDVANGMNFGVAASISGGTAVIGAPGAAFTLGEQPFGAAYIFSRPASGWSGTLFEIAELIGPQGGSDPFDEFGFDVAISGNTLVAGAPEENVNGNLAQGAAHVYELRNLFITLTRFLVQGPIRVAPGVPVEFRVQVEVLPQSPVEATGVVLVDDGAGQECRAVLDAAGNGACPLSFPSAGTYRVRAHFLGNARLDESISRVLPVLVGRTGGP